MERTEEENKKRRERLKKAEWKEAREFYASSLHLNKPENEKVESNILHRKKVDKI